MACANSCFTLGSHRKALRSRSPGNAMSSARWLNHPVELPAVQERSTLPWLTLAQIEDPCPSPSSQAAATRDVVGAADWQGLPSLFVLSLGLGWIFTKTGRLIAPIIVHMLFNGFNLLMAV